MKKKDITKNKILQLALQLFQTEGFEKTTMRQIAEKAELSLGAFYYYFKSKDDLVLEFYYETQNHLYAETGQIITSEKDFKTILKSVFRAQFMILLPYRNFLNILLKNAAYPDSALSPFSKASKKIRDENIDLFRKIILNSNLKLSKGFIEQLPHMLWLLQLALIFFWLYDSSPEMKKSHNLIENLVDLMYQLIKLQSLPLIKPFQKTLNQIITDVVSEIENREGT